MKGEIERGEAVASIFILSRGEYGEGSTIEGVFLTREDAIGASEKHRLLSCDYVKVEEWVAGLDGGAGQEVFYKRGPQGVTGFRREIELRSGPELLEGRRVSIDAGASGLNVPLAAAGGFSVIVFRPTGLKCSDGVEIWTPQDWSTH